MDLYTFPGAFQTLLSPLYFTVPRTQECINKCQLSESKMDEWMNGQTYGGTDGWTLLFLIVPCEK